MERFFQILAVILGGIAAYFLWQRNGDRAFISAVFASVAFFLSVRFQVKARNDRREKERLEEEKRREEAEFEDFEDEDFTETPQLNEIPANSQIGDERRTTDNERTI